MKTFFAVLVFIFLAGSINATILDTTITERLSPDKMINTVKVKDISSKSLVAYELNIDNMVIVDSMESCYQLEGVNIVDLDVNDLYKEIVITGLTEDGAEGEYCKHIYKLDNSPKLIGKLEFYYSFELDAKGLVTAEKSISWCSFTDNFKLSAGGSKLEKVTVDYHPIEVNYFSINPSSGDWEPSDHAVVVKPFNLLVSRDEKAEVAAETKIGEKITLTGYDDNSIEKKEKRVNKDKNKNDVVTEYPTYWNWIKIKTESGNEGWILLESCAFEEIIDGVHCVE